MAISKEFLRMVKKKKKFRIRQGPIPWMVPLLKKGGREFASGRVVLEQRLLALESGDPIRIHGWCHSCYDVADSCFTFEDMVKVQPSSAMLKGIQGIVSNNDGTFVACDTAAVNASTNGKMEYFPVTAMECASYGHDGKKGHYVTDVCLFKYDIPQCCELSADQFNAIDAMLFGRPASSNSDMDFEQAQIVKGGHVVIPMYKALFPSDILIPLVAKAFEYNLIYLPPKPKSNTASRAEWRAFNLVALGSGFGISGGGGLGGHSVPQIVGVPYANVKPV